MQSLHEEVRGFIESKFVCQFGPNGIGADDDLFQLGVIDSFGLVELVSFVESTFGIELSEDELLSPELASLNGMVRLFSSKAAVQR